MKRLYIILISFILFVSCSRSHIEFEKQFKLVMEEQSGTELFNSLIQLDQNYPNMLVLKVNIGAMLLVAGDFEKAGYFLKKGEELAQSNRDKGLKALLYTNLAELSYRKALYEDGVRYADLSLSLNHEDSVGVIFTKAKCLLALDKKEEAREVYSYGWKSGRDMMGKEDMGDYIRLLRALDMEKEIIVVIDEYVRRFGYESGFGAMESYCYETLGLINESIVSAAKDLEYLKFYGKISKEEVLSRLTLLEEKIEDSSWNPSGEGRQVLSGLKAHAWERWQESSRIFSSVTLDHPELPYFRYLVLSSILEQGSIKNTDFKEFIQLEKYFSSLPGYYYHLWHGMKKRKSSYSIGTAKDVLEKCILLAPHTAYAKETREELGHLLGLSSEEGSYLLLGPELDALYESLSAGSGPEILGPVLELLSIKDNVYSMAALLMLKGAQQIPAVEDYLKKEYTFARGRLKEKLAVVLEK
jgi:hypothetical protein